VGIVVEHFVGFYIYSIDKTQQQQQQQHFPQF